MILERRLIKPVWTYVIGDAISRGLLPPIEGWWKISSVPPIFGVRCRILTLPVESY